MITYYRVTVKPRNNKSFSQVQRCGSFRELYLKHPVGICVRKNTSNTAINYSQITSIFQYYFKV